MYFWCLPKERLKKEREKREEKKKIKIERAKQTERKKESENIGEVNIISLFHRLMGTLYDVHHV